MCYFQRVTFACGCQLGVMRVRPCAHVGTPACQRRHLLDRVRVRARCELHALWPSPADPLYRPRPPRRHTLSSSSSSSSSAGGVGRRTGGLWIIRRRINGGGGVVRGGANNSQAGSSP
jgi:hypothetical protein